MSSKPSICLVKQIVLLKIKDLQNKTPDISANHENAECHIEFYENHQNILN